ncbi:MAG: acyl-CoA dehydrogenase family protein [Nocardioidaceae bacterium]
MSAEAWRTPERIALRDTARRFVASDVLPELDAWEDKGEVPRDLHRKAAACGLLGLGFTESDGGSGGDAIDVITMTEAMIEAGASSGLMAALFTHGIALPQIVASADPALIERYVRPTLAGDTIGCLAITEPDGGSDVASITTRARREGEHFVVDGAKTFITSGVRADFATTAVRTGGPGHRGISLLVVDTRSDGVLVGPALRKMGWLCSDTAEITYTGAKVPASHLVGEIGGGFAMIMTQFVAERLSLAAHAYSVAQRALDLTVAYAKQRVTFGRPLVTRQVIAHRLVEMHRRTTDARFVTRSVAERVVAGDAPVLEACLAKQTAVEACAYVVDAAVQIHGGAGYLRDSEVERHYRDARILGIGGGATEVLTDLAARLLGFAAPDEHQDQPFRQAAVRL